MFQELEGIRYRNLSTSDTSINPAETGFYYLNSRYYDPEVGRFLNADVYVSNGQGVLGNNMFTYCLNNPINKYDCRGERAVTADMRLAGTGSSILSIHLLDILMTVQVISQMYSKSEKDTSKDVNSNDVDWNKVNKNHVLKGTKGKHIKGWERMGFDPKGSNWSQLIPLFREVMDNSDTIRKYEVVNGHIVEFYKTYIEEGIMVMVKIWISKGGEIIRFSDAIPYIIND